MTQSVYQNSAAAEQSTEKTGSQSSPRRMQDSFLNHCRKEKVPVFLDTPGSESVTGLIVGFDDESIILEHAGSQQLYFKSGLTCIRPRKSVNFIFNEAYRYRKMMENHSGFSSQYH